MSHFTALNLEPGDDSEDEVDNTKELQIEEALKLYQNALKLYSQGPKLYHQASEAFEALFRSEIFKYPESTTEFVRISEHPELELAESLSGPLVADEAEQAPSTLPQILYLSYKNHGQFILDCVRSRLGTQGADELLSKEALDYQATAALNQFALALASDESDTELWRRAARVGAMLGSRRISRYCLEAAVEVDDDPTVTEVDPPSLEEGFSGVQLKEHLQVLSDEVSLSHPIMAPFLKKTMAPFLTKHIDPYDFLPDVTKSLGNGKAEAENFGVAQTRCVIDVPLWSWTALGDALFVVTMTPQGLSGVGVCLRFPGVGEAAETNGEALSTIAEDQVMKDVGVADSPAAEANEPPTAIPVASKSDDQPVEVVTTTTTVPLSDGRQRSQSLTLPTRKRSQSAAGIRDTPEDDNSTQKRSKRIRNRDATSEVDPATQFVEQLKGFGQADEDVFTYVGGLLSKLGVDDLGTFEELQTVLSQKSPTSRTDAIANTSIRDLRIILQEWDDTKASTFVNGNAADILGSSAGSANAGLAAFLENSKSGPLKQTTKPMFPIAEGLAEFVQNVDCNWMPIQDVVWDWLCALLGTYRGTLWPDDLKIAVVRMLSFVDADIFTRMQLDIGRARKQGASRKDFERLEELTQTVFELHLDIYARITNPSSIVPFETRVITKDRLDRWAVFAADVLRSRVCGDNDEISLRYLWASVFYATMAENVSRDHKVLCWSDLQTILDNAGGRVIELQNNAVIPEISVAAAEREVSRLTTMDFFFNLFQPDTTNPLAIIETLEPVLDPESAGQLDGSEAEDSAIASEVYDNTPPALREMWKFLRSGSTSLRLFLWQRLREAYSALGYTTKVFSCHLKSIEVIVSDLRTEDYADSAEEPRQHQLLLWLKALDELLVRSLTSALNDAATCFEIIDDRHIKSTCTALAQLNRILHSAAIFDDEVRVGMVQLPQHSAFAPNGSFSNFISKLREMQVRTWALQYTMVKEATTQNRDIFPNADKDLADFLALVHYILGLRKFCKASNKIFLKMMKVEMIRLKHVDKWEDYLGQVLYDLYGLRLGIGTFLLEEHGCPAETLDRRTVLNIADQVIIMANKMPMKDFLKHELRVSIERMQTAVGPAKSTPQMLHNLRNLTEYLKTSIRPIHFYQALRGGLEIDSVHVVTADSGLADNGWYFLQGMIALGKFRSQKRLGPGGQIDDMRVSATFMKLQLQYTTDHWEAWYRLAQCYDFELEDEVMWSADKINNHGAELVKLQRSSIHCYVMALSTAIRNADDQEETALKISEMYHDFGMRLYASSREPFTMEAFYVDDFEKHMSGKNGMYKKLLHEDIGRFSLWRYAAEIFRRAAIGRPDYWMNHFMIGKCRWKMHSKASEDRRDQAHRPTVGNVLNPFLKAIATTPKPKDNRQEPILEPHYKIVSIVHKLVVHNAMEAQAGANLLQDQPYAIRKGEPITIAKDDDWVTFVLEYLRNLRNTDKQHWQHRMVSRVAHILYNEGKSDIEKASAARHEFRESIFTKTMHIQVWKPDAERAGRHCVYMERYVRFMINVLWDVNDKANTEQLVKRVRKKGNDFFRFNQVWTHCCMAYIRLIRCAADVAPGTEEYFRSVPANEFEDLSQRLGAWCSDLNRELPALDAIREANELKKVNMNLMKSTPIDDLIGDCYAALYIQVATTLPSVGPDPVQNTRADAEAGAQLPRPTGPMSLNNLVMNMDGTQIPVSVMIAGSSEPGSRPRKTGVSRREVLRRAELISSRPEVARPSGPSKSRTSESLVLGSSAQSLKQRRRGSARSGEVASGDGDGQDDEDGEGKTQDRLREDSSTPGSLHDSADDESDLSDVPDMEDMEQAIIFPGLVDRDKVAGSSGEGEGVGTPGNDREI